MSYSGPIDSKGRPSTTNIGREEQYVDVAEREFKLSMTPSKPPLASKPKEEKLVGEDLPVETIEMLRKDFEKYLKDNTPNIKYENLILRREHRPELYKSLYSEYAFQAWISSWKKYKS